MRKMNRPKKIEPKGGQQPAPNARQPRIQSEPPQPPPPRSRAARVVPPEDEDLNTVYAEGCFDGNEGKTAPLTMGIGGPVIGSATVKGGRIELTGALLPRHLQLDKEALTRCGRCGSEGWGDEMVEGYECRMTQPDGFVCGGRFVSTGVVE